MSEPTRRSLPIILIRGFGGFDTDAERKLTYQGFTDGSVYPHKQGENYIYEGLILRFMKSHWGYQDATNVIGYYSNKIEPDPILPKKLLYLEEMIRNDSILPKQLQSLKEKDVIDKFKRLQRAGHFSGDKIIIDPAMALHLIETAHNPCCSLWVFRFYDLKERKYEIYGQALVRLIDLIRDLATMHDGIQPKVNILAHSMGGLLVREAVQRTYPQMGRKAEDYINKIVTLGTPHQGVSFQIFQQWLPLESAEEFEHFSPKFQSDPSNPTSYQKFKDYFPLERLLAVVGTNYRTYNNPLATKLNQLFPVSEEFGLNYNRSDGLVKQTLAQIPGAARTFINKCHGGFDSLLTSRESFEVATRFFFGNVRSRLRLIKAKITRGKDWFGKSEFFFGVSIKPRGVDFELFHQSKDAENCYGPFTKEDLSDNNVAFPWADEDRLMWEGYLDTQPILEDESITPKDMVMRLDFYLGERDLLGIGFSDNLIFRQQYYVRTLLPPNLKLYLHTSEEFARQGFQPSSQQEMRSVPQGWEFDVKGAGFEGTFRIEIDYVPEEGKPVPLSDVESLGVRELDVVYSQNVGASVSGDSLF
jgi:pimeloyl-ACP methyl ester carboxylesterase